ncbi:MAG: bifunctional nuclease family protein [Bacteroidales bacterium]|nr:bifunctional nuclease family protein [Bacteroidales bacterium]
MNKIALSVLGLTTSQSQSGSYALILQEEDGNIRIPIIIGAFEAQSIAIALEGLRPPRPLTHDLFLNVSNAFNIQLTEIEIYKIEEGIFYSRMHLKSPAGKITMDARTSDAVALAIRFNAPIYVYKDVLEKSGIVVDDEEKPKSTPKTLNLKDQITQLKKLLKEAIKNENYEEAARLKTELSKLESKS